MNDEEIGELTRSDIPVRGPHYWENINAALAAIDDEAEETPSIGESLDTGGDDSRLTNMKLYTNNSTERRPRLLPVLAAAAAIAVIVGLGALLASRMNDSADVEAVNNGESDTTSEPTTETTTETTAESVSESTETTESTQTTTEPETEPTTETTATSVTETTESVGSELVNQAEPDLRFDYGFIVSYEVVDGVTWIAFDRSGFGPDQLAGPDLDFEPRYEMATDFHGGLNTNPLIRTYRLADGFDVLELDPATFEAGCSANPVPVDYVNSDLDSLLNTAYSDGSLVSLTFDDDVEVIRIRDQRGC